MGSNLPSPRRGINHTCEIVGSVFAIALITAVAFFPAYGGTSWDLDPMKAGQFGDLIGGYFGTAFLVVSVAVVVGSYRSQRKTNEYNAFESRFFELLRYHRDNTIEIDVGNGIEGRRAFVSFIREWRILLGIVKQTEAKVDVVLSVQDRGILAYLAFFHGSGLNSRETLLGEASPRFGKVLVLELIRQMTLTWEEHKHMERKGSALAISTLDGSQYINLLSAKTLAYTPCEGHHSRLAHYFRHLLHLSKYALRHAPGGFAGEYVDLVRSQLTTHEQAVLALHSAAVDEWKTEDRPREGLIKDIPPGFIKPHEFDIRSPI
jgi:hypothetical protein